MTIFFIVEDCPSACSIADKVSSIALMGTSLLQQHVDIIKKYKNAIVALDKDATVKAIEMTKKISHYVNCKVAILSDDLKILKDNERERIIRKHIG